MSVPETTVIERTKVAPRKGLIHILSTCCAPWTHTLCGRSRSGSVGPDWKHLGREDCVVCLDLEKSTHHCPRCGSRLSHR